VDDDLDRGELLTDTDLNTFVNVSCSATHLLHTELLIVCEVDHAVVHTDPDHLNPAGWVTRGEREVGCTDTVCCGGEMFISRALVDNEQPNAHNLNTFHICGNGLCD